MTSHTSPTPAGGALMRLTLALFIAYLCVGIALPIVPVFATRSLGLGNAWAGLAVGIAFLSTLLTRGLAGQLADQRGGRVAARRGLLLYVACALASSLAEPLAASSPWAAYAVLLAGRLLLGVGESLVAVGVISWGIALVGPARSGQVLARVGAALYGALAVGAPLGLALQARLGFAGALLACAAAAGCGLLAIAAVPNVAPVAAPARPSLWRVVGEVGWNGAIVCAQGIGFAAIGAFFALDFLARSWPHAGLGLTAFGTGFVIVRVALGTLPDRFGGWPVAIGSLAVEAVGQALVWAAPAPAWALAGAFLTGLGCSLIFPAMGREVVRQVAPERRGTALGAFSAFQDLAYGLTGPLLGLLADRQGHASAFLVGACAALAGLALALLQRRTA